jgi:CRISPR-associated protein Csm5
MPDYCLYHLTISTLTPLHIGNGRELMHEYDYAIHKGSTWRLNEAALLEAQTGIEDPRYVEMLSRTPPARLLTEGDFVPQRPYFRYVIRGVPRSQAEGAVVREQLKDPFDRIYIPGSSLKGALRTALAWYAWKQRGMRPDVAKLGRDRSFAAQPFERDLFGEDSNHNLLRALQISDSQGLPPDETLMLINARVLNRGGNLGAPIEAEAIRSDREFEATLKIDRQLYSEWARRHGLNLENGQWLDNLVTVVRAYAQQRIADELQWYKKARNAQSLVDFYQTLQNAQLPKNAFLLELGWGTGWESKTLGSHLKHDAGFMRHIIRAYRLGRGNYDPDNPFPKSRRVIMASQRDANNRVIGEQPALPLGWVLVEMTPVR